MVQHIDWEIAPENAPPQSESSRSVSGGLWDLSSTDTRRHRQDVAIKRPLRTLEYDGLWISGLFLNQKSLIFADYDSGIFRN